MDKDIKFMIKANLYKKVDKIEKWIGYWILIISY
jgi:hypothetical protein